jgi:hypothetical protein
MESGIAVPNGIIFLSPYDTRLWSIVDTATDRKKIK